MLWALILAILPPPIANTIRRWSGWRLAQGSRIAWLAVVSAKSVEIGESARIGPFAFVRCHTLLIGPRTTIKPLALLSTHTIHLGESVQFAPTSIVVASASNPKARLVVGDHSRIFPFCWLEPGEGIQLGKHVGIGGHGLIFTHGVWTDYLNGGLMAYAPVVIEDRVWLPWRVTVQAGVTIGSGAIVMSGSVVTRSLPPGVIAGGAPAKVLREPSDPITADQRQARAEEIIAAFREEWKAEHGAPLSHRVGLEDDDLGVGDILLATEPGIDWHGLVTRGVTVVNHPNLTLHAASDDAHIEAFADHCERYGIRLYRR